MQNVKKYKFPVLWELVEKFPKSFLKMLKNADEFFDKCFKVSMFALNPGKGFYCPLRAPFFPGNKIFDPLWGKSCRSS
ncbi:MAG: hypothetical protein CM15mP58_13790 [Burkholderiaceae bacterium]|nr:MAG: hypothetical protein CM15mP58_13790 [Burkholderiaceae bacterium]